MRIMIVGNMGYIGPILVRYLRQCYPRMKISGFDMGYFATCLTGSQLLPECRVDVQQFGDVRRMNQHLLKEVDAIVYLAAISNDPMGAIYENVTLDVNYRAAVSLAEMARENGVRTFVFASSCSVYGSAEEKARTEESSLNPLTAYARSKILAEQDLAKLASPRFTVTSLRFATACGMSPRLRLDLVLNDFVASALTTKKITILSDGTPWRPLIHVLDMARAIHWAVHRTGHNGGDSLAVNVGSDEWNYQVRELAEAVAGVISGTQLEINPNAQPDKRSYRVSFQKYKELAPGYQPQIDLKAAIGDLRDGLYSMAFQDSNFRSSVLIRLNVLKRLRENGYLTEDLCWTSDAKLA